MPRSPSPGPRLGPGLRVDGMGLYDAALRLTVRGFTHVALDVELGLDGTAAA